MRWPSPACYDVGDILEPETTIEVLQRRTDTRARPSRVQSIAPITVVVPVTHPSTSPVLTRSRCSQSGVLSSQLTFGDSYL